VHGSTTRNNTFHDLALIKMTVALFVGAESFLSILTVIRKRKYRQSKKFLDHIKNIIPKIFFKKVNFKVTITEKYSRISCELVADPKISTERTLDTAGLTDTAGQTMNPEVSHGFPQFLHGNSDTVSSKIPKGVFQINY